MRYSVISSNIQGGWRVGKDKDYIEYKNRILSVDRLKLRLELLDKIPLQSIKDQIYDQEFCLKVVLMTTDQLPVSHKKRLEALKIKYKWLHIDYLDEKCTLKDYSRWVKSDVQQESLNCDNDILYGTFRLDDDDALSKDFLKNASKFFKKDFVGFGISFLEGYSGIYDTIQRKFTKFYDLRVLNLALGLGYINLYSKNIGFSSRYITVYDLGNHSFIDKKIPVVVSGNEKSFIRTVYDGQDTLKTSLLKQIKGKKEIEDEEVLIKFPLIGKICSLPNNLIPLITNVDRTKNNHRFDLLEGRYTYVYRYQGIELIFYGHIKPNCDKLIILLPGAVNRSKGIYNFQRHSWSDEIDGSVLVFLDPTIANENNINIGWFQGDSHNYAIPILENLIKEILKSNSFRESNLTLFGSSAGGFTCLKLADSFLNSSVKVINPQTIIYNYSIKEVNKLIEWIYPNNKPELTAEQKERLRVSLNLKDRLKPIIYYQNKHDGHHVYKHLEPLLNTLPSDSYSFLEDEKELDEVALKIFYYEDEESGHSPPNKEDTLKLLNN